MVNIIDQYEGRDSNIFKALLNNMAFNMYWWRMHMDQYLLSRGYLTSVQFILYFIILMNNTIIL